jgi:hypothetical protein
LVAGSALPTEISHCGRAVDARANIAAIDSKQFLRYFITAFVDTGSTG